MPTDHPADAPGDHDIDLGGDMSRLQRLAYRILRSLVVVASTLWLRASVRGREHVPRQGAFILAPVHRSNLDTPLVAILTPRILRYMGKESLWKANRAGAWFLTSLGGFPVERGTADRAALRAAQTVLARGEPLVMFPEGTRRFGPVVKAEDMHDGPAFVAGRMQVPVVPVGIGGSERAMPKGAKFIRPRKVIFIVGEPIPPPALVNGRVPRRAVREYTDDLRERVQALFDEAQIRARA